MIQVGALNFQHFYELVVLLEHFLSFLKTFFISTETPREIRIFITNKPEDLENWSAIVLNQRIREVIDRNREHIRIKITINIVDSVC